MNITVSPAASQVNTPSLPQTPKPIPRSYVQDMPSPNYLWTPTLAMTALQDRLSAVSSTEIMADNATENTVLPDPGISRTPSPVGTNTSNAIPTLSSLYDLLNATSRKESSCYPTENSELALPAPSDTPTIPDWRLSGTVPVGAEASELMVIDQEESQLLVCFISDVQGTSYSCNFQYNAAGAREIRKQEAPTTEGKESSSCR